VFDTRASESEASRERYINLAAAAFGDMSTRGSRRSGDRVDDGGAQRSLSRTRGRPQTCRVASLRVMAESNAHLAARLRAQRPPHPTPTASNALAVAADAAAGDQAKI